MQLILIVQLSIAMLAGELAGTLPLGFAPSVAVALLGPFAALLLGSAAARRAERAMDAGDGSAVDRMHVAHGRLRLAATMLMLVAAAGGISRGPEGIASIGLAGAFLLACGIAATIATIWAAYPVERRIREASIMRQLDSGRSPAGSVSRTRWVVAQLRAGLLPLLVPLLVPLVAGEVARAIAARAAPGSEDAWQLSGAAGGAVLLFILVPVVVPVLLGLRRLEEGELRADLESLSRDARVPVGEIWVWPTDGLVANAAVMGLFPRLRCVMLTDSLLECMPREQVRAVMAHELGHVKRRHLPWLVLVVLACWAVAGALVAPAVEWAFLELEPHMGSPSDGEALARTMLLVQDAAVLATGLLLFGWTSRRFERQADTFAVQVLSARERSSDATPSSVDAMVGALGSVAFLNHVPRERPSWRHGSIRWRQEYLRGLEGRAHGGLAIDVLVAILKWSALGVVGIALVADLSAA